ncbi:MAG: hypothetical protein ILP11_03090 [Alphaproteobacteria bacterium]|nr:hypothetical protein [Alphaproteobacteria bacterium]
MKYIFLLIGLSLSGAVFARSHTLQNMSDAQQLGAWAGMALACNAGNKLDDFELIASRIIGNQAASDEDRAKAFKEYAAEKLRTYNLQRKMPTDPCDQVLAHFDDLPIFRSEVYQDGSVKLPDGKVIPANQKQPQNKRIYMQTPTN